MNTEKYLLITVDEQKHVDIDVFETEELAVNEIFRSFGEMLSTSGSGTVTDAQCQWVDDIYFYGPLLFGKMYLSANGRKITKLIIKKI